MKTPKEWAEWTKENSKEPWPKLVELIQNDAQAAAFAEIAGIAGNFSLTGLVIHCHNKAYDLTHENT